MKKAYSSLLLAVILLLTACRKDSAPVGTPDQPLPLLKSITYTDDLVDTTTSVYDYDAKRHLQKFSTTFKTPTSGGNYYRLFTWTGNQVAVKEYDQNNQEMPGTTSLYELNGKGFSTSHVYQSYSNNTNSYIDYKNLFEYTPDNYIKRVSNYYVPNNTLMYVYEYQYNGSNLLDSISGSVSLGNNNLLKFVVWTFQYEEGKKNTIGNSAMSSSFDDVLNLSGKSQPYALSKETLILYNGSQKRSIEQEDNYRNEYDAKGLITGRSRKSYYFQADGSVLDSLTATYIYKYQ
jgi:hypothetical protein